VFLISKLKFILIGGFYWYKRFLFQINTVIVIIVFIREPWKKCITVSPSLSDWFLKDHVALKTGLMST